MSFCPSCGAPVKDSAKFCEQCGAPLAATPQESRQHIDVHPEFANDTIVWEGKEYTAQEWADRFGGMSASVDTGDGGHVAEGTSTSAATTTQTAMPARARTRRADREQETETQAARANAARAVARAALRSAALSDASHHNAASTGTAVAPYTSPLTDEERAAGKNLLAPSNRHARDMRRTRFENIKQTFERRAGAIRTHVNDSVRADNINARYVLGVIEEMAQRRDYQNNTVSFNSLDTVVRFRSDAQKRIDANNALSDDVTWYLDDNVQPFLDDAEALVAQAWASFDGAALARAEHAYDEAHKAWQQALTVNKETPRQQEKVAPRKISESFERYTMIFVFLFVATLVVSLACWLFLHVAPIIMLLPIVRTVSMIGVVVCVVASMVTAKTVDQKAEATAAQESNAIKLANTELNKQLAQQEKAARDHEQRMKQELDRARAASDPAVERRLSQIIDDFTAKLDALDRSIDTRLAAYAQAFPLDNFEHSIDENWLDELHLNDPKAWSALVGTRNSDAVRKDTEKTNAANRDAAQRQADAAERMEEEDRRDKADRRRHRRAMEKFEDIRTQSALRTDRMNQQAAMDTSDAAREQQDYFAERRQRLQRR